MRINRRCCRFALVVYLILRGVTQPSSRRNGRCIVCINRLLAPILRIIQAIAYTLYGPESHSANRYKGRTYGK